MATFFGEVVLPSSRVFFDEGSDAEDEDDDLEEFKGPFQVDEIVNKALDSPLDILIISDGVVARGFSDSYLLGESPRQLGQIPISTDDSKKQPVTMYSLNDRVNLLDVPVALDVTLANRLTLTVADAMKKTKRVVILCSRPSVEFLCDSLNLLPPAFVRVLTSSASPSVKGIEFLNQPNFLTGVPASVMTWCEASDVACQLVVLYSDKSIVDAVTVQGLVDFFKGDTGLSGLLSDVPVTKKFSEFKKELPFMYT